eukprot:1547461-Prymnesium_polylepis.1
MDSCCLSQERIIPDEELKEGMAAERPYQEWMASQPLRLDEWVQAAAVGGAPHPPRDETNQYL